MQLQDNITNLQASHANDTISFDDVCLNPLSDDMDPTAGGCTIFSGRYDNLNYNVRNPRTGFGCPLPQCLFCQYLAKFSNIGKMILSVLAEITLIIPIEPTKLIGQQQTIEVGPTVGFVFAYTE